MSWNASCAKVSVKELLDLQKEDRLIQLPVPLYSTVVRLDKKDAHGYKVVSVLFTTGMLDTWGLKYFASAKDVEHFLGK